MYVCIPRELFLKWLCKCSLGIILKDVDYEEGKKGYELCSDVTSVGTGDWPFKRFKNPWVRSETLIS